MRRPDLVILRERITEVVLLVLAIAVLLLELFFGLFGFEETVMLSLIILSIALLSFLIRQTSQPRLDEVKGEIIEAIRSASPTSGLEIVEPGENYSVARRHLQTAKSAKATFFMHEQWALRPNERTYDEWASQFREQHTFEESGRVEYFKELDEKVDQGRLRYEWIICVESLTKFLNLIDRIISICGASPTGIRTGFTEIYVLDVAGDKLPTIPNLQICSDGGGKSLVVSFMETRSRIGNTIVAAGPSVFGRALTESAERWFDLLKQDSMPLIAKNCIQLANLRSLGQRFISDKSLLEKELRSVEMAARRANVTLSA